MNNFRCREHDVYLCASCEQRNKTWKRYHILKKIDKDRLEKWRKENPDHEYKGKNKI